MKTLALFCPKTTSWYLADATSSTNPSVCSSRCDLTSSGSRRMMGRRCSLTRNLVKICSWCKLLGRDFSGEPDPKNRNIEIQLEFVPRYEITTCFCFAHYSHGARVTYVPNDVPTTPKALLEYFRRSFGPEYQPTGEDVRTMQTKYHNALAELGESPEILLLCFPPRLRQSWIKTWLSSATCASACWKCCPLTNCPASSSPRNSSSAARRSAAPIWASQGGKTTAGGCAVVAAPVGRGFAVIAVGTVAVTSTTSAAILVHGRLTAWCRSATSFLAAGLGDFHAAARIRTTPGEGTSEHRAWDVSGFARCHFCSSSEAVTGK